jgi:poly(A) polymerase
VGGAVRDLLSGRAPADLDFVVPGDPKRAAEAIATELGGSPFAIDEDRRQYRVVLESGPVHDIDVGSYGEDIEADLRRRDFTVDALAVLVAPDGSVGDVIDLLGGLDDLEARRLRMTSEQALREDPLRLLRAARLSTELGLDIEDGTAEVIRRLGPRLGESAPERQRDELVRILETPRAASGVRLLDSLGLLRELLPELEPARGVDQPEAHHYWDVFNHSVETLAALDEMLRFNGAPSERPWLAATFHDGLGWYPLEEYLDGKTGGHSRRALLKLAGLLHDVSKPETKTVESGGRVRFFGHPEKGAVKAESIGQRLRFGTRESHFIALLVEEHLRPTQLSNDGLPSQRAVYRFFRDLGDAAPACLILSLADAAGATGPRLKPERWRGHVAYVSHVLQQGETQTQTIASRPRLVTGSDVMAGLGLEPGPVVGELMRAIEEAIAAEEVSSREEAIELAGRLLRETTR